MIAPIAIIRAGNDFFEAAKGDGVSAEAALKKYILEMRHDTSLTSVMRIWNRGAMAAEDVRLHSAR